jgi:hypothetical protein
MPMSTPTATGQTIYGQSGFTPAPAKVDNDPAHMVFDPASGTYRSSDGNHIYRMGPNGQLVEFTNPSSTNLIAQNDALGAGYRGAAADYMASLNATMGAQRSLADAYARTISDPNAPSVARAQLLQALEANQATQRSAATGASGANAFIARRNAANNIAALNARAGQAAAELRAGEVANAQKGLADVYGQLAGEAGNMYGATTGLGLNYSQLATTGRTAGDVNATARRGQNINLYSGGIVGGSSGLSGITAPSSGGGAAAGGGGGAEAAAAAA